MITFDSIHETYVTFEKAYGLESGQVCRICDDGTVGPCLDEQNFCGVVRYARNGLAGVVLRGICTVSYTGSAPIAGPTLLCADGNGNVKLGGEKKYEVLRVDKEKQTADILL